MDKLIKRATDIYKLRESKLTADTDFTLKLLNRNRDDDYVFGVTRKLMETSVNTIWTLERYSLNFITKLHLIHDAMFLTTRSITKLVFLDTNERVLGDDIGDIIYCPDYWLVNIKPDSLCYRGDFKIFKYEG